MNVGKIVSAASRKRSMLRTLINLTTEHHSYATPKREVRKWLVASVGRLWRCAELTTPPLADLKDTVKDSDWDRRRSLVIYSGGTADIHAKTSHRLTFITYSSCKGPHDICSLYLVGIPGRAPHVLIC
jgi:hypothetical protein